MNIDEKIEACARELKSWGDKMAKNFKKRLQQIRERMERFRGNMDRFSVQCYKEATKEYSSLLSQHETFWKQRAKQYWLKGGDCNSKFFHAYASARKKKTELLNLKMIVVTGELGQVDWGKSLNLFMSSCFRNGMLIWRRLLNV